VFERLTGTTRLDRDEKPTMHSITHGDNAQSSIDLPIVEHLDHENDEETRQRIAQWGAMAANLSGGFTQMPNAVRQDKNLSTSAKLVYEHLLSYMWQRDYCWPSQERIADELHISRRTVIRACDQLYRRGYIEIWRRGLGLTNYYFVNPLSFVTSTGLSVSQISLQPLEGGTFEEDSPLAFFYGTTFYADDPFPTPVCQDVTSGHDTMAPPQEPNEHTKNTKLNYTDLMDKDSKFSSDHKEEVLRGIQPNAGTGTQNQNRKTELEPEKKAMETRPNAQPSHQDGATAAAISQATSIPPSQLEELGISPQARKRPIPQFIEGIMGDLTDALGDRAASRKSNITRAAKYYYLMYDFCPDGDFRYAPEEYFERLLYIARAEALECTSIQYRNGNRLNRVPAFFGCLENRLGLTAEERTYVRTDGPLYYPEAR
jgi:hypothetical protein